MDGEDLGDKPINPLRQNTALSVGGSDSCGGAGIQADLRVFSSVGVHGASAITALTAQNPNAILQITPSPLIQFEGELQAIANYYDVTCIKTGMLFDDLHLQSLLNLKQHLMPNSQLVIDPVLVASSGALLFDATSAREAYTTLISHATIWTPNLQEAAFFLDANVADIEQDMFEAAAALLLQFKVPVLLKGGHQSGDVCNDIFADVQGNLIAFEHPKKQLQHDRTHGTGCRLASALAAYLSLGLPMQQAIEKAQSWLQSDLTQE